MQGYPINDGDNEIEFQGFNNSTRRNMDGNAISYKDMQDKRYSNYSTTNYYNDADRQKYLKSLNFVGMAANKNKDGYGKFIDTESQLIQASLTNPKVKQQLATRPFKGWPYMGAGETHIVNPDLYSRLSSGTDTRTKKAGDAISGASLDRFIPLVPCLASNVQNPEHIIPEYWVRGGESSRAIIQNVDYLKMCGFK